MSAGARPATDNNVFQLTNNNFITENPEGTSISFVGWATAASHNVFSLIKNNIFTATRDSALPASSGHITSSAPATSKYLNVWGNNYFSLDGTTNTNYYMWYDSTSWANATCNIQNITPSISKFDTVQQLVIVETSPQIPLFGFMNLTYSPSILNKS